MEFLAELLFSFAGEALVQFVFEVLADLGFRAVVKSTESANSNRVLRLIGCFCIGALAGGLSLLLFPKHMIHDTWLRVVIVVVVPALAGWWMSVIGSRREAKGQTRSPLEVWANGYSFALAMSLVRFFFAK